MLESPHDRSKSRQSLLLLGAAVFGSAVTIGFMKLAGVSGTHVSPPAAAEKRPKAEAVGSVSGASESGAPAKLTQILSANDPRHKAEDLRRLGREAGGRDLTSAMALGEGMKNGGDRAEFYRGVLDALNGELVSSRAAMASWASMDPRNAVEHAKGQFSPGPLQSEALTASMQKWGQRDARAAFSWAEANLNGPVKSSSQNAAIQSWASNSGNDAARWFDEESGSTDWGLFNSIAGGWAQTNPPDAAKWVESKPNAQDARQTVINTWGQKSPPAMAEFYTPVISTLPPPEAASVSADIADVWATKNPVETSQWVAGLPEGPPKASAANTLAQVWSQTDIPKAAEWSQTLPDSLRPGVVGQLATVWGATQPDVALEWVARQPANIQPAAVNNIYDSWASTNARQLEFWVADGHSGAWADSARRSLTEIYIDSNPPRGMETALAINDTQLQGRLLSTNYRRWQKKDPDAALDWWNTNRESLPEAARQAIGGR
jgi:hypothetical protein